MQQGLLNRHNYDHLLILITNSHFTDENGLKSLINIISVYIFWLCFSIYSIVILYFRITMYHNSVNIFANQDFLECITAGTKGHIVQNTKEGLKFLCDYGYIVVNKTIILSSINVIFCCDSDWIQNKFNCNYVMDIHTCKTKPHCQLMIILFAFQDLATQFVRDYRYLLKSSYEEGTLYGLFIDWLKLNLDQNHEMIPESMKVSYFIGNCMFQHNSEVIKSYIYIYYAGYN